MQPRVLEVRRRIVGAVDRAVAVPADSPEEQIRKKSFTLVAMLKCVGCVVWAAMYAVLGLTWTALVPAAYALILPVCILLFFWTRKFSYFVNVLLFLMLVTPVLVQWTLGGFAPSGAVILWSLLTPVGALVFRSVREAQMWFALFVLLVVASVLLERFMPQPAPRPFWVTGFFFTMNIGVVTAIVFFTIVYFVGQVRTEVAERQRAEAERVKLDAQLQHFRYLYQLRSALSTCRTAEEAIDRTGHTMMAVLSAATSGGVRIVFDGRERLFGEPAVSGQVSYRRPLVWGGRGHGELVLFCGVSLHEAQEHALLDETTGQLAAALEARELEMQLLQSARLVSMGQMAAGVAHELNQPLTVISTATGNLYYHMMEGLPLSSEEVKETLKDVLEVTEKMGEIIDHLRIFSRDTHEEEGSPFLVNEAVEASLKMIGTQLEHHHIALDLDLADDLPPVVGHPHQVEQVFLNLLSNARDALDERADADGDRQKRLCVRTFGENHGEGWVVAEVSDNGTGIDAAHLGRLFEPFFTTKAADRGTGLGLSISYAIVKRHGGELTCESRKGDGTVFRMRLPAAPVAAAKEV